MDFIKILFNIAFTVLPLLLQLLLQIPAARTTSENNNNNNNNQKNVEITTTTTTTTATMIATSTTTNLQTSTITTTTIKTTALNNNHNHNNKNKNNIITTTATTTTRELRKHEQIIDNSIDFTVDPCDDFYQYACGEWKPHNADADDNNETAVDGSNDSDDSNGNGTSTSNFDADVAAADEGDGDADADGDEVIKSDRFNKSDKYDRTLAMIDFMADKEVLKYFNKRNVTKKSNATQTQTSSLANALPATKTPITTKEPDFIIKVYKYYKSCIAIQKYEPIKYLEWLELNEHVKWPSLINTRAAETTTTTTTNSVEQTAIKHDHQDDAKFTTDLLEEDEIILHETDDDDDDEDDDNDDGVGVVEDDAAEAVEQPEETLKPQISNSSWVFTLALLRKYGLNGIFIEEIIYTTKTFPSKMLLGFNKPTNDGGFKSLKNEQLKIIVNNLNRQYTSESFKSLWLQLTKFEWQLTKLNDLNDAVGTTMVTIEQLPVPWLNYYLQVLFNQTKPLDSNMRIVITNVAYLMALDDLLAEYDDNFLQQYLQIRFLWHLQQQQPQEFQPFGCISHIKRYIPLAFEWIFEKQRNDLGAATPHITEIFASIRKQFNHTLYNNKNNFDSSTLEKLVSKLETIQLKVGTFSDLNQAEFFYENRKFYSPLKLSSGEFYFNHLKMLKFNFDALHFGMRSIGTNSMFYDMQEYNRGLLTAPHFNQRLNTLHIPLSLLQPPVYHQDYSDVYKYSSLGFILAQTLMYGFNLNGLAVSEHEKSAKHFKCLSSLDPLEVNDKIADASGFRLAYHAFFHTTNSNLIANRKIFFLNFAQTFCGCHTSDDNLGRSPVNYALAQFAEFAKTFECSPDSHMNPHEKCYLWD